MEEHKRIAVPPQLDEVTPVYDSIQFTVAGLTPIQIRAFQKRVKDLGGFKLEAFGLLENARNWRTWKFLEDVDTVTLPQTDENIGCTCDTRLGFEMSDKQIDDMVNVIHRSLNELSQA